MASDQRDQRADGAAAEDEDGVTALDIGPIDVVHGDGQGLDQRGVIVGDRVGHAEEPRGADGPVLLHPARKIDAEDLELVAEVRSAHAAGAAASAADDRLHHDSIAACEPARAGRLDDLAEGLMADDAPPGYAMVEVTLEDVKVRAADADPADPQERLVANGRGLLHLARRERPRTLIESGAHGLLARALVSRLLHAIAERAGLPRFLHCQAPHVEEAAENQVGPRIDQEGVPGALGLDQRHILEHRAGLLPLGAAQVEDATREQHCHHQERQGSHRISSLRSLEDTRERLGRLAEGSGDSPDLRSPPTAKSREILPQRSWHASCDRSRPGGRAMGLDSLIAYGVVFGVPLWLVAEE